jgi:MFS family permease
MLCVQVAAYIAAPYFTPFMLKKLELGYADYVALLAASFGAKILTLPVLGRFAKEHGARRLLWIAGFGIVPLAAGWTFSTDFTYLLILQVFAGCAWACYELATFLLLYETIPDEERTAVMTLYNMGNALAIVIGSTLGGWLLHGFGETHAAYAWVFAVSSAARLVTLPLLARVRRAAVGDPSVGLQTLTVRPSDGSIDGPILPSLHHREEEALTDSPTTR